MVANLESPDLAATGHRIERVEEERGRLVAEMEDHLRQTLLCPFDPADLQALSAAIAALTHRVARALYVFGLLGAEPPPGDLRAAARLVADVTAELVETIGDLTEGRGRAIGERVRSVRQLRDAVHLHAKRVVASDEPSSAEDRDIVLFRTVGKCIDDAATQALVVADEVLRLATKHE